MAKNKSPAEEKDTKDNQEKTAATEAASEDTGTTPKASSPAKSPAKKPSTNKPPKGPKKTKAKAGAKSPAKPKTKAKATGKGKPSSGSMKRPSSKVEKADPKAKTKAKAKSLKEMTSKWATGAKEEKNHKDAKEGEEEEEFEDDGLVDPNHETRDYARARKWSRLSQAGAIPEDLMALFENGAKGPENPRRFKTSFINSVFAKNKRGEYILAPGNPAFAALRQDTETRMASQGTTGMPYSIMLHKNFHGHRQDTSRPRRMQKPWATSSKWEMWHYAVASTARTKASTHTMTASGGEKNSTMTSSKQ